jgi:hypothetical protein
MAVAAGMRCGAWVAIGRVLTTHKVWRCEACFEAACALRWQLFVLGGVAVAGVVVFGLAWMVR